MNIQKTQDGNDLIFKLSGRLDTTSAPKLQAEVIPEFDVAKSIVLDFAELVYVSSAGLRVLLMGVKTAKGKSS